MDAVQQVMQVAWAFALVALWVAVVGGGLMALQWAVVRKG